MKKKIFDWIFLILVIISMIIGLLVATPDYITSVAQGLLLTIGIFDLINDYKEK